MATFDMDKNTLQALRDSIEKWRQIERGEMIDAGPQNCMLCQHFIVPHRSCSGCPVMGKTGRDSCDGTPYEQWIGEQDALNRDAGAGYIADTPKLVRIARAERKFLESLLPKRK